MVNLNTLKGEKKRKRKKSNTNYYSRNKKAAKALDEYLQQRKVTESISYTRSADALRAIESESVIGRQSDTPELAPNTSNAYAANSHYLLVSFPGR